MCKITLIDLPTLRPGVQLYDVEGFYDDNIELGNGMLSYKIIEVPGLFAKEVKEIFKKKQEANVKNVWRTRSASNNWSFEEPERDMVWNDNGKWKHLANKRIERSFNLNLSEQDIEQLKRTNIPKNVKTSILEKATHTFGRYPENNIEVTELNA